MFTTSCSVAVTKENKGNLILITVKKLAIISFAAMVIFSACGKMQANNPLLGAFDTPSNVPPFDKIKTEHYLPAFKEGIKQHDAEIKAIAENKEAATFENTIVAIDTSGSLLNRTALIFFNLKSVISDDEMQKVAEEIAPMLSKHSDDITFNKALFDRVKAVYDKRQTLKLNTEQNRLVELIYKDFERAGAGLDKQKQDQLRKINEELSKLGVKFSNNLLAENSAFKLILDKKDDLAGLPQSVIDGAATTAKELKMDGKWVFTLDRSSITPFLTYSSRRDLREKIYTAYLNRGNNNNKNDNKAVIKDILKYNLERSKLLGFTSTAAYILDVNMAKTPDNVFKLLKQLWTPALKVAKKELADMQVLAAKDGVKDFQSWDWNYYAEKVRKAKYDLDEEQIRPYFSLDNVTKGIFYCANKLYGLEFKKVDNLPIYHKDVTTYEVTEKGKHVGILYMEFFPRESKSGGAWCTGFRQQTNINGKFVAPVVSIACNFTKPNGNDPALLSMDETETLFHEFGHALNALLANTTYNKTGAAIPTDFVELPSQINEHWAFDPEVLKVYAKHYKTGEVIPASLVEKMGKSDKFNQGFATTEYLAASLLDMSYYTLTDVSNLDINKFEKDVLGKLGLIPQIAPRYRTTYFAHIWGGGYSAGYYAYIWAEVLDADGFELFKEKGIFDPATAKSFRDNVLSQGAADDAMAMYKRFRGAEPSLDPLLKNRGLK